MSTRYIWNRYNKTSSATYDTQQVTAGENITATSILVASSYTVQNNKFVPTGSTAYVYVTPEGEGDSRPDLGKSIVTYPYAFSPSGDKMWHDSNGSFSSDGYWRLYPWYPSNLLDIWAEYGFSFGESTNPRSTETQGSYIDKVSSSSSNSYPSNNSSGSYWYVYLGSDNIDPSSVSYSTSSPTAGSSITIRASTRSPSYGGTVYYLFSYSTNGGSSWTNIGSRTTSSSTSVTVPSGASLFRGRVVASDNLGFTSTSYVTGSNLTVSGSGGGGGSTDGEGAAYVGVSNKARSVSKIYVGVNGKAREVVKGYIGIGGKARLFWPVIIPGWKLIGVLPSGFVASEITFGNGTFMVTGSSETHWEHYSSKDAVTWRNAGSTALYIGNKDSIFYGNGKFITVTTPFLHDIPEGYSDVWLTMPGYFVEEEGYWHWGNPIEVPSGSHWSGTYGAGKYVMVNDGGVSGTTLAVYSTTGLNWTETQLPSSQKWSSVAYGDGAFVAIAKDYEYNAYSTDGVTWKTNYLGMRPVSVSNSLPIKSNWCDIAYGEVNGTRRFVAVTPSSDISPMYASNNSSSSELMGWDYTLYFPGNGADNIQFGDEKYIATKGSRVFFGSGGSWSGETYSLPVNILKPKQIVYGNGKFIAIKDNKVYAIESSQIK